MNNEQKKIGVLVFPKEEQHFLVYERDIEGYQKPQRDFALTKVRDWSLCIDVGAHVGIFSRHFAKHFEKVMAFEPIENLRDCLVQNVPTNVEIVPKALGAECREVKLLKLSTTNSGCSYVNDDDRVFRPRPPSPEDVIVSVPQVTIDSLNLPLLGLVKIDVQGCDHLVLRGATETLRRCKPVVLVEEKPVGGRTGPTVHIQEMHRFLRGLGYRDSRKVGADRTWWV